MERVANIVLALPRPSKRAIAIAVDVVLCSLAVWIAFYLRLDQWVALRGVQWLTVVLAIALAIPIFMMAGLYRAVLRYSGSSALLPVAQAAIVYGVIYASIITVVRIDTIPRTVGIIQPVLLFLFVSASRLLASWWLGSIAAGSDRDDRRVVMIYGAGAAARQLYHGLASSQIRVAGFIADDARMHGRLLLGKQVYSPSRIEQIIEEFGLTDILLALPPGNRKRRNEILEMFRPLPVAVRTIPSLSDVAQGRVEISEIRELDVEDLLGREPVAPDKRLLSKNISGKTVLVTGAGGSIGSELCRQIVAAKPKTLLLVEMSEAALYSVHQELEFKRQASASGIRVVPLLASVCDEKRIRGIISAWHPETIFHAAAYKHVPLVEHNPAEGMWNNAFGTLTVANAAVEAGVSSFVFISTDKAVRPTNVMGGSKRLAEQVLQAMAARHETTRFSIVRFGNVLDSSGSVVPLFREQIRAGGPITITHPEITRYFMTIPEAAQLVIQAGAMAAGGEVFVLDMGEPVRILDLARKMVELSGLKVREAGSADGDIEFSVVGLRPGEKLYEELLIGNDPIQTSHPRIMQATEHYLEWDELLPQLNLLQRAIAQGDIDRILRLLRLLVPEYQSQGDSKDWVHLEVAG